METRAHHLLIGFITLLGIGGALGFIIYLARLDVNREYQTYKIFFTDSVVGLSNGASVRYNGVPVGSVTSIQLNRDDPTKVRVLVQIDETVPINQGIQAELGAVGLTGVAYVELTGGDSTSAPILKSPDDDYPIIPAGKSALQEVFRGAPDLLREATVAVQRVSALLDEKNQAEIAGILENVNTFTGGMASSTDEIQNIIKNMDETIEDFRSAARAINNLSSSAEQVLTEDAQLLIDRAEGAVARARELMAELTQAVAENRSNIKQFTNSALPEATKLMADIRRLTASLQGVAERLQNGIGDALFAKQVPEYGVDE
ncbi:MAG: MlaD family protein [Pseudomonadota bacterium]